MLDRNDYKRGTNWSRVLSSRTLFASFCERQRQNDVAGVGTRAATSLVAMLSATSGQPLSTDQDNVVGPMILRLTPVLCLPIHPPPPPSPSLSAPYSSFSPCARWYHCDCGAGFYPWNAMRLIDADLQLICVSCCARRKFNLTNCAR